MVQDLHHCQEVDERLHCLNQVSHVAISIAKIPFLQEFLLKATKEQELVIKSLFAIGQGERIFQQESASADFALQEMLDDLQAVDQFYSSIGGLVGYHLRMLELLSETPAKDMTASQYYPAEGIDIAQETQEVRGSVEYGLEHMDKMAEIYPVGGAADRLRLQDEHTGEPLPAACLPFLGKTLLEGMIVDLQAREYLYYKLKGYQLTTPIAMMTSKEKNNHGHVLTICEESNWFGRSQESFRFFCQPSVPTVNKLGQWCLQAPFKLILKPGGHGAIWRLAQEKGIFDWFESQGRTKVLVRQINNPVAGTDYGILAFTGIGCSQNKIFGFASCPRQIKTSEGVNVIIETPTQTGYEYVLTNIEYCDFKRFGIVDQPEKPGSLYSQFSSNTNLLFADLKALQTALTKCSIPGILVNLKKITYHTGTGQKKEEEIARLESTMQNIADFFPQEFPSPLEKGKREQLATYLTYNKRRKTISTTKKAFTLGASLVETPEGCFLDSLNNGRDLLLQCHVGVPEENDASLFFTKGPSFIFLYHPALGPLYSIIAQKIRGGKISYGSELQLQIAELDVEELDLQGSLLIHADAVMGHTDAQGLLNYSERTGKCTLKNVTICNKGIDFDMPNVYWKNEIARQESCHIILRGYSEFYAENLNLTGDFFIEVEDGYRVTARQQEGEIVFIKELLADVSWHWNYHLDSSHSVVLKKQNPRTA